jgi:hypothetical protein
MTKHRNPRAERYARNKVRENLMREEWVKNHPAERRAHAHARRAARLQATPPWAKLPEIRAQMLHFYQEADLLSFLFGTTYHVDHIAPLLAKWIEFEPGVMCRLVSGINAPVNLQILDGSTNCSKHNRLIRNEVEKEAFHQQFIVERLEAWSEIQAGLSAEIDLENGIPPWSAVCAALSYVVVTFALCAA